jgi:hypothetical protein
MTALSQTSPSNVQTAHVSGAYTGILSVPSAIFSRRLEVDSSRYLLTARLRNSKLTSSVQEAQDTYVTLNDESPEAVEVLVDCLYGYEPNFSNSDQ